MLNPPAISPEREVQVKKALGRYLDYLLRQSAEDVGSLNLYELILVEQLAYANRKNGHKISGRSKS